MNSQNDAFAYAVDIVMCIDVTSSMRPVIDEVKDNAIGFREHFERKLAEKDKRVEQLRVRVVAYRDFAVDADALQTSEFFVLPEKQAAFESFVRGLTHGGGGDAPESGLDALAIAMRSDWVRSLDRRRHVVILFTDAPSHPLGHATGHSQYPAQVAESLDELVDQWNGDSQVAAMESSSKRLLMFAPDAEPWTEMSSVLEYAIHYPSQAGRGMADHDFDEVLELLAQSV